MPARRSCQHAQPSPHAFARSHPYKLTMPPSELDRGRPAASRTGHSSNRNPTLTGRPFPRVLCNPKRADSEPRHSWFCDLYREWASRLKPTLRQVHPAGERLFVDYAGSTMTVVEGASGEARQAEIFVAVLGASSFTFACAVWSQTLPDWIGAHVCAFGYFGLGPTKQRGSRGEMYELLTVARISAWLGSTRIAASAGHPKPGSAEGKPLWPSSARSSPASTASSCRWC